MLIQLLSDFFPISIYDWGFRAWNLKDLAEIIMDLLKFNSEQIPQMKPLLYEVLKKNKLEFPWKRPGTLEGEERTKVSMKMHLFIFLVPLHLCPSEPQGCHLNERFQASEGIRKNNI